MIFKTTLAALFLPLFVAEQPAFKGANVKEFVQNENSPAVQKFNNRIKGPKAGSFRLVTYNVGKFDLNTGNMRIMPNQKVDWKNFAADVLPKLKPDIIGFNEWPFNFKSTTPRLLNEMQNAGYTYITSCGDPAYSSGNAIFVKAGVVAVALTAIDMHQNDRSKRCVARAKITLNGEDFVVAITHLDNLSGNFRMQQAQSILASDLMNNQRLILAGDMNEEKHEPTVKLFMQNGLTNSMTPYNPPTYSHKHNKIIDHIFYKGKMTPKFMEMFHTGCSDHLPVITDFTLDDSEKYSVNKKIEGKSNASQNAVPFILILVTLMLWQ